MGWCTRPTPQLDPVRLHVAHHELGHKIAWDVLGVGTQSIKVWGYGRNTEGAVVNGTADRLLRDPEECRSVLIGLLAGREADMHYCTQVGIRFNPTHSKADMQAFRRIHKHQWVRGIPVAELERLARTLILDHWADITRLAPLLAEQGHL